MYEVHIDKEIRAFELYMREETGDGRFRLPTHKVVCPRCHGEGTHWNQAFSDGFTPEELDEDPDFAEDLMRGVYDVVCEECEGRNVVDEVDLGTLSPEISDQWGDWMRSAWETHEIWKQETAMGA